MKIEIIYFNAGGGHRAAAKALEQALMAHSQVEVQLTNLFDIIDVKQLFKKITRYQHEDIYNKVLASGWTIGLGPQLKVLQAIIKTQRASLVKKLCRHWNETAPDLVVSVIPNFNRAIGLSLPGPFCTVMTDIADYPPSFWIEPTLTNQHVIAGSEMARAQAIVAGVPLQRVHLVSGMMLRPGFYKVQRQDEADREPTGLVMFGGIGSTDMVPIAKKLKDKKLVLVCGKNTKLQEKLQRKENPNHEIVGFVDNIPELMARCDYFIGKPGPGSISEAVHLGLPVIVTDNIWTMPQEEQNITWIKQNDVGLVLKSFSKIDLAVEELLVRLPGLRANALSIQNRAVFEIPPILLKLVQS